MKNDASFDMNYWSSSGLEISAIWDLKLGKKQWIREFLKYQYNKYFRYDVRTGFVVQLRGRYVGGWTS